MSVKYESEGEASQRVSGSGIFFRPENVVIAGATAGDGSCVCTRGTSGGDCVQVCCTWTVAPSGESALPVVAVSHAHAVPPV